MKSVLVDTSALIALGNIRDQFHAKAKKVFKELVITKSHFLTTNAVILELTNAFSDVKYKPIAIRLLNLIEKSNNWTVITIDEEMMKKGINRFKQMKDKDWSVVDCISMIIAEDSDIIKIFTNDHHFVQAGFIILLQ